MSDIKLVEVSATPIQLLDELTACKLIEQCARVSYRSEPTGNSIDFVKKIAIKRGHETILEFVDVIFKVVCSRGIAMELLRHRHISAVMESTRYVNYNKKQLEFIKTPYMKDTTLLGYNFAQDVYTTLIVKGSKPEEARDVLPNGVATTIAIKANLREWKHILKMRNSTYAHQEMQILAKIINDILVSTYPNLFSDDI